MKPKFNHKRGERAVLNIPVKNCCGCTACYNICSRSAIQMLPDQEGFLYPVVDAAKCCECHLCEKVCPIMHSPSLPDGYSDCVIAQNNSQEVLDTSTSGGFIDALCRYMSEKRRGYVAGVAYNSDFLPEHMIVNCYESAKSFRNSKYTQSNLKDCFSKIRDLLDDQKSVLFIGTPCQVAGLKSFLGKHYHRLVTADLVCRSVPSPKLWHGYLDWQEKRYKSKIKSVTCRKKTYGYHSGALEIEFVNGKRYVGSNRVDYYMKAFHKDICSRPSCYNCHFRTKHRCSDFTVFDSWRPHFVASPTLVDDDRGYSNVLVHTQNGKDILDHLDDVSLYRVDPNKLLGVMGSMITGTIEWKKERSSFYSDLDRDGFIKTVKRYSPVSLSDRMIERAKPIRYAIKQRYKQR